MALTIADFTEPKSHPFGMLEGYQDACQKEQVLGLVLLGCIRDGDLNAEIQMKYSHEDMVADGLLSGSNPYRLTRKAIGLLYTVYGNRGQ